VLENRFKLWYIQYCLDAAQRRSPRCQRRLRPQTLDGACAAVTFIITGLVCPRSLTMHNPSRSAISKYFSRIYLRMLEARRFFMSATLAFSSLTRLWRIWAYSFCGRGQMMLE
jgi:hypothetical protein